MAVALVAVVAVTGAVTAAAAAPASGAASAAAARRVAAHATVKPGRIGKTITLARNVSFDGDPRSYQMATDRSGATYIAWISANATANGGLRVIHLCVIPNNDRSCAGGVKALDPTGGSTAAGLQLIVTPSGKATILWIANSTSGSNIYYATASKTGPLSAEVTIPTSLPVNSDLFDAVPAPDGSIWLLAAPTDTALQLRKGLTAAPTDIRLPHSYTYGAGTASLAFAGSTPIVVAAKSGGGPLDPNTYSYEKGSSWTAFKNVPNSGAYTNPLGLVHTPKGVRLLTGDQKNFYYTAISKWTGHGFTRAAKLGDNLDFDANDASTDPSGRLVDAGMNDDRVTVANLADTVHPAAFSFGLGTAGEAGGAPAVTTSARGRGWVAWSYQGGNNTSGDALVAAPIVLAGLHTAKTAHGHHGSVTVVGPASCLPPVSISISVAGHPDSGWTVAKRQLTLGGKKVGTTLKGASLIAGKSYKLTGTVTFARGHARSKTKATLTFTSCPNS